MKYKKKIKQHLSLSTLLSSSGELSTLLSSSATSPGDESEEPECKAESSNAAKSSLLDEFTGESDTKLICQRGPRKVKVEVKLAIILKTVILKNIGNTNFPVKIIPTRKKKRF